MFLTSIIFRPLLLCSLLQFPLLSQDTSFFFIQLSDPQFGMYWTGKNFSHERENVGKAVEVINRLKPDFVVVTGDLVHRAGDPKQIAAFKEEFGKIDSSIPVYLVSGNHDVGNRPSDSSLARYRREFGSDHYAFERHGVRFIVLNSSLIKENSKAPEEARKQEDWLMNQFSVDSSQLTVVFQHHPWFIRDVGETNAYYNLPRKKREGYLDLFIRNNVTHVFAGHLHENAVRKYRTLEHVVTGPIGKRLGMDPSGIRIVTVSNGNIKHQYYTIGQFETLKSAVK